jgi:hypothetical protein
VKNGGLQQHGVRKSAVATIHDRLPLDGILAFLGEEAGDLLSEQEKASLKPRELFRLVISRMEDGPPFTYIGSVREPVEADFYAKI